MKTYVHHYVERPRMAEGQIREAFNVGENNPLFRAVIQILYDARHNLLLTANSFSEDNTKTNGMVGAMGGWDALNTVITVLEEQRKQSNKD